MAGILDYPEATNLTGAVMLGDQGGTKNFPAALFTSSLVDGSVTTSKLADDAVTTDKLADDAVTESKISAASVTSTKLAAGAVDTAAIANLNVTSGKLADGAVTTVKLADLSVEAAKIAVNAVNESRLAAASVTSGKLAVNAVITSHISTAAVTTDKLADGAVQGGKIANGSVTGDKLANGAVSLAKMQTLTAARLLGRRSGSNGEMEPVSLGTGLVMSSDGVLSATAGGGATTPALARVAYVDLTASGAGATVGGSAAFATATAAYAAAVSFIAANGGSVAIILGPGAHSLLRSGNVDMPTSIRMVGMGSETTSLEIIYSKNSSTLADCRLRLSRMTAAVSAYAAYEAGQGQAGQSLRVEVLGDDVTLTLAAYAGHGGAGAPGDDGGTESADDGEPGGDAGTLTVTVRGCRLFGLTLSRALPGTGGLPSAYGGSAGADGAYSSTDELRIMDCPVLCSVFGIQNFNTVVNNYSANPNAMVAFCGNSYLGTLGELDYTLDNCQFMDATAALTVNSYNNSRIVLGGF